MGLKSKPEVKHVQITGSLDQLNNWLAEKLGDGWKVLDAKLVASDPYNNEEMVVMFYLLVRGAE